MVQKDAIKRTAQRTQGSCQSLSVKSNSQGNPQVAKLSTYLHSRDGLWRLLACFPPTMPVAEALERALVEFTGRKEVAL